MQSAQPVIYDRAKAFAESFAQPSQLLGDAGERVAVRTALRHQRSGIVHEPVDGIVFHGLVRRHATRDARPAPDR